MMGGSAVTHEQIDSTQALLRVLADPQQSMALLDELRKAKTEHDEAAAKHQAAKAELDKTAQEVTHARAAVEQMTQELSTNRAAQDRRQLDQNNREATLSSVQADLEKRKSKLATDTATFERESKERTFALDQRQKTLVTKEKAVEELRVSLESRTKKLREAVA